jgi:tetratricopeptide (TPR) repeat protein/acyl carrier protein
MAAKGMASPMEKTSDQLAAQYTSLANDKSKEPKVREAAMLFSVAEMHLYKYEGDECFQAATDALGMFKEVNETVGVADTQRVLVAYYHFVENDAEAMRMAEEEAAKWAGAGNKYGQACMMLATAEVSCEKMGSKKREAALELAKGGLDLFKEIGNEKMAALTNLCLTNVYIQLGIERKKDAEQLFPAAAAAAGEALATFKGSEDRYLEAKALHGVACAAAYQGNFDEAAKSAKEALAIWKEVEQKQFQAFELNWLGQMHLANERPQDALQAGQEAMAIYQELGQGRGMEAVAMGTVVLAYLKMQDSEQAEKMSEKRAMRFEDQGDRLGAAIAIDGQLAVQLAKGNARDAVRVADKAISMIQSKKRRGAQDDMFEAKVMATQARAYLGNDECEKAALTAQAALKKFIEQEEVENQASVLISLSQAHAGMDEPRDALRHANQSKEFFRQCGNRQGEAVASMALAGAQCLRGDTGKAVKACLEAQRVFREVGSKRGEADAGHLLTHVYIFGGDYTKAAGAAKNAQTIYRNDGLKKEETIMSVLQAQASFLAAMDESPYNPASTFFMTAGWEAATKTAKDAAAMGRKVGDDVIAAQGCSCLAQVYAMTRQSDDARTLCEEAISFALAGKDERAEGYLHCLSAQLFQMRDQSDKIKDPSNKAIALFKKIGESRGESLAEELVSWAAGEGGGGAGDYEGPSQEMLLSTVNDVALSLIGSESLAGDTPLMDAGLDSLASVEFQNTLAKEFQGVNLPSTLVFDFPTPAQISEFIYNGLRDASKKKAIK